MTGKILTAMFVTGLVWPQDPVADVMMGNRGTRVIVKGNLIDLDCFFERGGFGPAHARCSRLCAQKGLPEALLDGQGRIYLIQGRIHQPLTLVNQPLAEHLESTVVAHGELLERLGVRILVIEKLERAGAQTPWEEIRALYEGAAGH